MTNANNNSVLSIDSRTALMFMIGGNHHCPRSNNEYWQNRLGAAGIKMIDCPNWRCIPEGFYKVDEDSLSSYQFCGCFNPTTMEYFSTLEWDYEDCRMDDNEYRSTSIDRESEPFAIWFNLVYMESYNKSLEFNRLEQERKASIPVVGDTVEVVKGRTLPKGTTGVVTKIFTWRNSYGYGGSATYVVLDNDKKININNVVKK